MIFIYLPYLLVQKITKPNCDEKTYQQLNANEEARKDNSKRRSKDDR